MIGEVKWFNSHSGLGFIQTPEGDALVHYSDILTPTHTGFRTLNAHELVGFEAVHEESGLRARNVFRF